ncbi:MAG: YerC/YecD family TrpR-related protein [Candidatus Moraniibacteriota bacterium]|jgi:TrpR-related protein YerC/YecD
MNWKNTNNQRLVKAILALETETEAERFLRDLMTENEIIEFSGRLQIADLLTQKTPYSKIEKVTGFSSTTIARVSQWLRSGEGGYQPILDRISSNHHATLSRLRKR